MQYFDQSHLDHSLKPTQVFNLFSHWLVIFSFILIGRCGHETISKCTPGIFVLDNISNLRGQHMSHLKLRHIKPQFYLNLSMYLKRHGKFCFFTHLLTQLVGFPNESVGFDHFLSEHQGFSFKLNQILPAG